MMETGIKSALWLLSAYLIGGIPFGFLIGKMRGIDVRTVGSHNIGATNVFRTVGKKWGFLALVLDMLKGFGPTFVCRLLVSDPSWLPLAVGVTCALGHMLTPYMKFKGGKGVATGAGMLLGLVPALMGVTFLVFVALFAVSNFISLGSCGAAAFIGVAIWFPILGSHGRTDLPQCILVSLIALFVIYKHRANIGRLLTGTENKIYIFGKKSTAKPVVLLVAALSFVTACRVMVPDFKDSSCSMRVGTYNIRLSAGDIGTLNAWTNRCADLVVQIRNLKLDVFGLQEVCPDQAAYLREQLPEFMFVGDHRGIDRVSDEASPVFYRKDRFVVEKSDTFWLSETPDIPASKSWGTACPRVCTYLVLTDKRTGKRFCFANTHTDHVSELAREKGMLLILERMKEFGQGAPIVFTGDHNNTEVAKPARAVAAILKNAMTESITPPKGAWRTFNAWRWRAPEDEVSAVAALQETPEARNADDRARYDGSRIDYIWVSNGICVKDYETVAASRPGLNTYPSDHFPIVATIVLP